MELYACERDVIVVSVSAPEQRLPELEGFQHRLQYVDYLTEELMPLVYNWFPASFQAGGQFHRRPVHGRQRRHSVRRPSDKFAAAAILSNAPVNVHKLYDEQGNFQGSERQATMVKNAGGFEAFLNSHANVWDKLPEFIRLPQHPSLYFTVERTISYMTAMWNSKPTPKKSVWTPYSRNTTASLMSGVSGYDH